MILDYCELERFQDANTVSELTKNWNLVLVPSIPVFLI